MYEVSSKLISQRSGISTPKLVRSGSQWQIDDILAYLFASLPQEYITTDESKIHLAIFQLKKEYPKIFSNLTFSGGEYHPFSKELEQVLFRFYQSNILSTLNPSFEVYLIAENKKDAIMEHLKGKFSKPELEKLHEMSKTLDKTHLLAVS